MSGPESEIRMWINKHKSVMSALGQALFIFNHWAGTCVTCLAEWKVVFGIVESQHWVVVSGHPCLRRRTLIQWTVLGFPVENTNMKIEGYLKLSLSDILSLGFFSESTTLINLWPSFSHSFSDFLCRTKQEVQPNPKKSTSPNSARHPQTS